MCSPKTWWLTHGRSGLGSGSPASRGWALAWLPAGADSPPPPAQQTPQENQLEGSGVLQLHFSQISHNPQSQGEGTQTPLGEACQGHSPRGSQGRFPLWEMQAVTTSQAFPSQWSVSNAFFHLPRTCTSLNIWLGHYLPREDLSTRSLSFLWSPIVFS